MSPQVKEELVERSVMVLQVFAVVGGFLAVLGALLYPVLYAAGYLT